MLAVAVVALGPGTSAQREGKGPKGGRWTAKLALNGIQEQGKWVGCPLYVTPVYAVFTSSSSQSPVVVRRR